MSANVPKAAREIYYKILGGKQKQMNYKTFIKYHQFYNQEQIDYLTPKLINCPPKVVIETNKVVTDTPKVVIDTPKVVIDTKKVVIDTNKVVTENQNQSDTIITKKEMIINIQNHKNSNPIKKQKQIEYIDTLIDIFGTCEDDVFDFMKLNRIAILNELKKKHTDVDELCDAITTFISYTMIDKRFMNLMMAKNYNWYITQMTTLKRQKSISSSSFKKSKEQYVEMFKKLFDDEKQYRNNPETYSNNDHIILMMFTNGCFDSKNKLQYIPHFKVMKDIFIVPKPVRLKYKKIQPLPMEIKPSQNYYFMETGEILINDAMVCGNFKFSYILNDIVRKTIEDSLENRPRNMLFNQLSDKDSIEKYEELMNMTNENIKELYEYVFSHIVYVSPSHLSQCLTRTFIKMRINIYGEPDTENIDIINKLIDPQQSI